MRHAAVVGLGQVVTYLSNLGDEHFTLLLVVRLLRRIILAIGRRREQRRRHVDLCVYSRFCSRRVDAQVLRGSSEEPLASR